MAERVVHWVDWIDEQLLGNEARTPCGLRLGDETHCTFLYEHVTCAACEDYLSNCETRVIALPWSANHYEGIDP